MRPSHRHVHHPRQPLQRLDTRMIPILRVPPSPKVLTRTHNNATGAPSDELKCACTRANAYIYIPFLDESRSKGVEEGWVQLLPVTFREPRKGKTTVRTLIADLIAAGD